MFNTSELDELFRILISIKGFKLKLPQWSNTTLDVHWIGGCRLQRVAVCCSVHTGWLAAGCRGLQCAAVCTGCDGMCTGW